MPRRTRFADVLPAIRRAFGAAPDHAGRLDEGAYSPAGRWLVRFADGRSAFVKAEWEASDGHGTAVEYLVYSNVSAPPVPRLIAYEAGSTEAPRVIVTEDLSHARWGAPVTRKDATLFDAAVAALEGVAAPEGIRDIPFRPQWDALVRDPAPLIAAGVCDARWIERYGERLSAAEATVDPCGSGLVHCDLWLQNWCRADRGVVMVDWAGAARGSLDVARAWGEAAVRAAGGPSNVIVPKGNAGWAAFMAGLAAQFAAEDHGEPASPRLVETIRREAAATLAWACEELEIEPVTHAPGFDPGGPWRP
ncbi:MAG TPA: hypothetical protein VM841_06535 [Actinomycetota bacterium]|nr:hypothetical protein [Actinomycetota bacterium]